MAKEKMKKTTSNTKMMTKKVTDAEKKGGKRKSSGPRKNSGVTREYLIKDTLSKWLQLPNGTRMSRPELIKNIVARSKELNIVNPENRKEIRPNKDMKKVFAFKDGDKDCITIFGIQKYITDLMIKDNLKSIVLISTY